MKILLLGNGGREHALGWKMAQSPRVSKIYVAPGNAGTAQEPKLENIDISATDIDSLLKFAIENNIDLTVVGPEAPLVLGIVDRFQAANQRCFGPSKNAARMEGSKAFCKDFLKRHNIPTAQYGEFSDTQTANDYLQSMSAPYVIKADGLAAGKGVIIAQTLEEATSAVQDMLEGNQFGEAGHRVVIEEFLTGEEASFICMVDGTYALPMASTQDHKARDNGDKGPNTGGMGAYSPAPVITPSVEAVIMRDVIEPTVQGMANEGYPFTGFLYAGLMIGSDGQPKVIEYNCRFGDPETQPILVRLSSDLVDLIEAALDEKLDQMNAEWSSESAIAVVMASGGYPNDYTKGYPIHGLDTVTSPAKIFHAGTALSPTKDEEQRILTNGGRVLSVVTTGASIADAKALAYQNVDKISWENAYYRTDIGFKAIETRG